MSTVIWEEGRFQTILKNFLQLQPQKKLETISINTLDELINLKTSIQGKIKQHSLDPMYLPTDSLIPDVNGGRGQEAVFVTGIYAPLQKLFALKGEVLDLIFSIK